MATRFRPPAPPSATTPPPPPNVDWLGFRDRLFAAAEAAGLRPALVNSQSEKGVSRGRAWVRVTQDALTVRREGQSGPPETVPWHDAGGNRDLAFCLKVLHTGRTVEVGAGVDLGERQRAVRIPMDTVDYPLASLAAVIRNPADPWDLDPDYQRGHVWTDRQAERFVGYFLVFAKMPLIFLNENEQGRYEVVDGKQRLTALLRFTDGEIPARLADETLLWWRDFDEHDRRLGPPVKCARIELRTRARTLDFYLGVNAGGTQHSEEEIARIRALRAQLPTTD